MPDIDAAAAAAVQPDLVSGETVLWAGRPSPRPVIHRDDLYLIPFSLLWGGFAIFWEGAVAGLWGHTSKAGTPWVFGILWGVPFVVIGQYLIWGRVLYTARKKQRTFYAVTNRRVLVVQHGSSRKMASAWLDTLPTLIKESAPGATGTLRFAPPEPLFSNRRRSWDVWDCMAVGTTPVFTDVEQVDVLYRLIAGLREKTTTHPPS